MQCSSIIFNDGATDKTVDAPLFVRRERRKAYRTAAALYEGLQWLLFSQK